MFKFITRFFTKPKKKEPRMYVIVRRDLSNTYRMVQGGHALAEYASQHPTLFNVWGNRYLIFLSVYNLIELRSVIERFKNSGLAYSVFTEEDLDDHETAIAHFGTGEIVSDLRLAP